MLAQVQTQFSPVNIFLVMLLCVWGFLYISGQRRGAAKVRAFETPSAAGKDRPWRSCGLVRNCIVTILCVFRKEDV